MGEPRVESEHEHGVVNDGWCIAETHGSDDEANATFISAARTDVPKLLALLDQARELIQNRLNVEGATGRDQHEANNELRGWLAALDAEEVPDA